MSLEIFLSDLKLSKHQAVLEELGYDDVADYGNMDNDAVLEFESALKSKGVPPGHAGKLSRAVKAERGKAAPAPPQTEPEIKPQTRGGRARAQPPASAGSKRARNDPAASEPSGGAKKTKAEPTKQTAAEKRAVAAAAKKAEAAEAAAAKKAEAAEAAAKKKAEAAAKKEAEAAAKKKAEAAVKRAEAAAKKKAEAAEAAAKKEAERAAKKREKERQSDYLASPAKQQVDAAASQAKDLGSGPPNSILFACVKDGKKPYPRVRVVGFFNSRGVLRVGAYDSSLNVQFPRAIRQEGKLLIAPQDCLKLGGGANAPFYVVQAHSVQEYFENPFGSSAADIAQLEATTVFEMSECGSAWERDQA
eukprot:CAMPEP_0197845706 /NCGR_PEP_ID=MMETSP1438-20131217/2601_1 /TAXON_ID=1461541 /ORGANISM="Pterosperma sp., Strain CCMP1384" /LENGTH=360 /DNA_ID=CAMNT_0043457107 /DNA_START=146 /DNA_END=1229 /DNA_ORIENTATION=+